MSNEWTPFPNRDDEPRSSSPEGSASGSPQPREDDTQAIGTGYPAGPSQPQGPSQGAPPESDRTGQYPATYAPAAGTAYAAAPQQPSRRSGRTLSAAVLAGALVIGGVAGIGGAAAYDAFSGDNGTSTSTSSPNISASNRNTSSSSADGSAEAVASKVLPSVVQINVSGGSESGSGSGIVLAKDGLILTNNHVASVAGDDGSMRVDFADGSSAPAKLVGADPVTDLAVIKAQGVDDLTPAEIGKSSDLKVGENVVAIGSPYGLGATVTSGIVSALNRAVSVQSSEGGSGGQSQENPFGLGQQQQQGQAQDQTTTYPAIQTDAAINPGNSGGPLANLDGQVIGINSSIRTSGTGSSGSIGLGFAIPMDEVLPIVNQLRQGETATHAKLGVSVSDNQSSSRPGALVKTVTDGDSASDAGIKNGDIITKVDDVQVNGSDSLVATVRGHRPDDKVKVTLIRDGKERTVEATLGSDEGGTGS